MPKAPNNAVQKHGYAYSCLAARSFDGDLPDQPVFPGAGRRVGAQPALPHGALNVGPGGAGIASACHLELCVV